MLKSIELSGFKSFADATRMEFSEGISVLVGPNGSGKSNIVDAIKWVLGEQSMKKLRGSEMTDVIFNGSGTRQGVNFAEVTLTFENKENIFGIDSKEVHLTRRIYRSGESEYLINRQASRLKDFREMLSGTGLGSQAYSIIEQGRVESLLQSSSVQRRVVFEEAAGIARFNSKKQEAQRRLDRVAQNLQRISDIVREVENQLRNTKSQAGKAQLYRQYTARLQELRTKVTLIGWHGNHQKIGQLQKEFDELVLQETALNTQIAESDKQLLEHNTRLEEFNSQIHKSEESSSDVRARIAGGESQISFQTAQTDSLQKDLFELGRQLLDLNSKNDDTEEQLRQTGDRIVEARRQFRESSEAYSASKLELENGKNQFQAQKNAIENLKKNLQTNSLAASRLSGEISGLDARMRTLVERRSKHQLKLDTAREQLAQSNIELEQFKTLLENLAQTAQEKQNRYNEVDRIKSARLKTLTDLRREISSRELRKTALAERISVLRDLLRKHEGVSPGVREVLGGMSDAKSPFRFAFGLVADLIRVNVEAAALIELALGQAAQYIVVSPEPELFRYIEENSLRFSGRVGFIWLDPAAVDPDLNRNDFYEDEPGVLGRADQFVETDPRFEFLIRRLLKKTWIVETLDYAKSLYQKSDGRTNFLTVSGECLTAEGTLIVGPSAGAAGLIARRSELRSLAAELAELEKQINTQVVNVQQIENELAGNEKDLDRADNDRKQSQNQLDELHRQESTARERGTRLQENIQTLEAELAGMDKDLNELAGSLADKNATKNKLDLDLQTAQTDLEEAESEMKNFNEIYSELEIKTTALKIEQAKNEERVNGLLASKQQFEDNQHDRSLLLKDHLKRLAKLTRQRDRAELAVLRAESELANWYAQKEELSAGAAVLTKQLKAIQAVQKKVQSEVKKARKDLDKLLERKHAIELNLGRLQQEQKTLFDRMREDYGIELDENNILEMLRNAESDDSTENEVRDENESGQNEVADENKDGLAGSNNESESNESESNESESNESESNESESNENEDDDSEEVDEDEEEEDPEELMKVWQSEIEDLRTRLQKIGSVNLEALETLETLQARYTVQLNQYNDLLKAHQNILKLIERINVSSQKLFTDTFEAVKIYFYDIFRKFFGGGHADLVLEDPDHPLESGIEIVVRPPGKELKSVSLLSGGEKTLTCVALLLAIFRYRVTPVCILDEVDAALDEGNVGRFAKVIQEFHDLTQFLIITHSKKTMMAARSMYGVTMQDSGVSKLISVQFDEVGENGEIILRKNSNGQNGSAAAGAA